MGIEDLAADGKHGLSATVASLFCRPTGAVTLDDEELALLGVGTGAVGELAGEVESAAGGRLSTDGLGSLS